MHHLHDLIGIESTLADVARAVVAAARAFNVPLIGGCHVTCSDETEWECAEVFDRVFAATMLPPLKPDRCAVFHTMNLGARYEAGAARVAEHHYAVPGMADRAKLMVVKINAHAAARSTPRGAEYGTLARYGVESACCGALATMFTDAVLPAMDALRETFRTDGVDRIAMLRDASRVRPAHRALLAAVTGARLQAAHAVDDVAAYRPHTPTVWLVVPCVTINRTEEDTELVVGQYVVDSTEDEPAIRYRGLGDLPGEYHLEEDGGRIVMEDDRWPETINDGSQRPDHDERALKAYPGTEC